MSTGFYWTANSPYLRGMRAKVRRAPRGLNPSIAMIGEDANPAHIIFECMTNRDWGMGGSFGMFDIGIWEKTAQQLYDEEFGLSLKWTGQTEIEKFINEIVDHIQATIYSNPRTGLLEIRLLRDDYSLENTPLISPDNANLGNLRRKSWGETSNEVVVTFTNPANEQEETVTVQDLANIAQQGGEIISTSRNYYAIRNRNLATRVASRDLRAMSQPVAACEATLDRSFWGVLPGDVVRLTWPEKRIEQVVFRVTKVNYGKIGSGAIKINLMEDIFALDKAEYIVSAETAFEDPSRDPTALDNVLVLTAPAFVTTNVLAVEAADLNYPEVISLVLAPKGGPDQEDFELIAESVLPNGTTVKDSFGTRRFVNSARLRDALIPEVESLVPVFTEPSGATPRAGSLMFIGEGDDDEVEIALIKSVSVDGWTLTRGVLDTIPRNWAAGTRIWSVPSDQEFADTTFRSEGEQVSYRLLTRTSLGILPYEDAPDETFFLTGRPHLPNRPANVKVNGLGFNTVDVEGQQALLVTWSNRNRLMETSQILSWSDGSVTPEAGQTTTIRLFDNGGALLKEYTGIAGTDFQVPTADFRGLPGGHIDVLAERGGLESLQAFRINISGTQANGLLLSGDQAPGDLQLSGDQQISGDDALNIGAYVSGEGRSTAVVNHTLKRLALDAAATVSGEGYAGVTGNVNHTLKPLTLNAFATVTGEGHPLIEASVDYTLKPLTLEAELASTAPPAATASLDYTLKPLTLDAALVSSVEGGVSASVDYTLKPLTLDAELASTAPPAATASLDYTLKPLTLEATLASTAPPAATASLDYTLKPLTLDAGLESTDNTGGGLSSDGALIGHLRFDGGTPVDVAGASALTETDTGVFEFDSDIGEWIYRNGSIRFDDITPVGQTYTIAIWSRLRDGVTSYSNFIMGAGDVGNWVGLKSDGDELEATGHDDNYGYSEEQDNFRYDGLLTTDWHFMAVAFDAATGRHTLYVDGVKYGELLNGTAETPSSRWIVGGDDNGNNNYPGKFYDPRIYDTALTDAQILELYNATNPLP